MKRMFMVALSVVVLAACKSGDKKAPANGNPEQQTADSLFDAFGKEHDAGMEGWMKIKGVQRQLKSFVDSITKLPAKAQASLAPLKTKLDSATAALGNAYKEMDDWMGQMNIDSAANNLKVRIQYLTDEISKASNIRVKINQTLQQADSLLKVKLQ